MHHGQNRVKQKTLIKPKNVNWTKIGGTFKFCRNRGEIL